MSPPRKLSAALLIAAVSSLVCCVSVAHLMAQEAADSKDKSPVNSSDRVYQLFIDECLQISPGKDSFPTTFEMGSARAGRNSQPQKTVEMKLPFRISKYETTQELYEAVMGSNPSRWKGPRNSAESMTILQAEKFCEKLTAVLHEKKLLKPSEKVRLPTEAEWEYCCRAGSTTAYSFGESATKDGDREPHATILNEYAWHTGNAAGNDPVVGSLKPNPWGLYDMHGYLWEFVSDPYVPQKSDATETDATETDDKEQKKVAQRLVRGGSWRDAYPYLTSDSRMSLPENAINDAFGFRCVISE